MNKQKQQLEKDPLWQRILLFPLALVWAILTFLIRPFSRKKNPKKGLGLPAKMSLSMIAVTLAALFVAGTLYTVWISRNLPDPDRLTDRHIAQSTKIYDRTGEHVLYEIYADERRTIIDMEDIPKEVVNGVIATEDTKFYEHHGVRPLSILRAFVVGTFTNKRVAGTSTLTQQLVKNAILTDERSLSRKIKEAILSFRLEQMYDKDQILKIYFNEIPYGSTNYGIEAASQNYFGKSAKELNLQESATLAGLPKAPSKYLRDKEALKERRNFVLRRMFEEGYITEEQKNNAQAEPVTLEQNFDNIKAPHFVLYVKEQLVDMFGENVVGSGGLKVITSLDWKKQEAAEKTIAETGAKVLKEANANNAALTAMDPKTGQILAMVGSADFFNDDINGQFNVATLGKRQPGSSFKPIIYAAAFEKGYTADTILFDVGTDFDLSAGTYRPQNYDLQERGPVTVRQALQMSLNIPAVQAMYLVGAKKAVEFSERLGYTTLSEGTFGLSLVLGGGEVKMIEHANAYGAFANGGIKNDITSILQVDDPTGDTLYKWKQKKGDQVIKPEIAALVTNVLSDDVARAPTFGSGGVLTIPGRQVAAKTGTTNNYIDAWTVGYTPSLVSAVWAGNTNNSPMKAGFGGSMVAARIWNAFMKEALKSDPVETFPAPPKNETEKPILRGSTGGMVTLKVNKITGKLASDVTPPDLIIEKSFLQPHSILHYVDKDNPQGPYPQDPSTDPQYHNWEGAIQNWITRRKEKDPNWEFSSEEPPTEKDDAYSLELIPTLEVIIPSSGSTLNSRQIDTDIRVTAPRGVKQVRYRLDDMWVDVVKEHPFNLHYYASDLAPGSHTLTVIVEDDIGNKLEQTIPFTLNVADTLPSATFQESSVTIQQSQFPRTFLLNHSKLDQIKTVRIYRQKTGGGDKTIVATVSDFSNLFDNKILVKWNEYPGAGSWQLIAEVELLDGSKQQTGTVNVEVQ